MVIIACIVSQCVITRISIVFTVFPAFQDLEGKISGSRVKGAKRKREDPEDYMSDDGEVDFDGSDEDEESEDPAGIVAFADLSTFVRAYAQRFGLKEPTPSKPAKPSEQDSKSFPPPNKS